MHWESRGWIKVQHRNIWTGEWGRRFWFFHPSSGYRGGLVVSIPMWLGVLYLLLVGL